MSCAINIDCVDAYRAFLRYIEIASRESFEGLSVTYPLWALKIRSEGWLWSGVRLKATWYYSMQYLFWELFCKRIEIMGLQGGKVQKGPIFGAKIRLHFWRGKTANFLLPFSSIVSPWNPLSIFRPKLGFFHLLNMVTWWFFWFLRYRCSKRFPKGLSQCDFLSEMLEACNSASIKKSDISRLLKSRGLSFTLTCSAI